VIPYDLRNSLHNPLAFPVSLSLMEYDTERCPMVILNARLRKTANNNAMNRSGEARGFY